MELALDKLIAHRGAPRLAPENTLASLRAAKDHGARWTEFDVTLSADNIAVVFHDDSLSRTTNGKGEITAKTAADLEKLDAGSWFAPRFHACKIPTLEQYLQCAAKLGLAINVELKPLAHKEKELTEIVLRTLKNHWPSHLATPLLSSFSVRNLEYLQQLHCPYPIALNCERWDTTQLSIAQKLNCYSIHCHKAQITKEIVQQNASINCKTLVYTVNKKAEARRFFAMGVTAIFSDIPDLLSR